MDVQSPPVTRAPVDDARRLTALRRLALLDTPAEEAFDRLTRLATWSMGAPVALVTLVDEDRQFFKSCLGLPEAWQSLRGTPMSHSFCRHVVESTEPLVIEDARDHPLVRENAAIGDLDVIAYAGVPLVTPAGYVIGTLCVIDRVPRRSSDEELATLRDLGATVTTEIELRLAVEEVERARGAVEERNERLLELDRLKDEFLSLVSHEFRTPLASMRGYVDLLSDDAAGFAPKQQRFVEVLGRNVWRLLRLVDDLLFVAQADAGRVDLELGPVELAGVAREAVDTVRPLAEEKGVALSASGERATVRGDHGRLLQLLENLVVNGVKFTPAGGAVEVSVGQADGGAVVSVRDTGIGIPATTATACSSASSARATRRGVRSPARASAWRWCGRSPTRTTRSWPSRAPTEGAPFSACCSRRPRRDCVGAQRSKPRRRAVHTHAP